MAPGQDTDLLTVAEAARVLKVSRITLDRWLKDGRLPSYRVGPRATRIRRGDLTIVMTPRSRAEQSPMKETQPVLTIPGRMTEDAAARQWAAYEAAKAHIEHMHARHGGTPRTESWPIIREARDERASQI
jgi:excisionase family DNA binding protein